MSNDAEKKEDPTGVATENAPQSANGEQSTSTSLTPEQLEELKEKASKAEEYWDRLLRQTADFDNYKKRATREKQEAIKFANEGLLMKLIPIVDNFEMALAATNTASTDP